MFDLTDRVVIVTGAAGNLGGAVAKAFGAAGARLALVDRDPDRLPRLFPDLANSPHHYLAAPVDLADEAAVKAMVDETLNRFGRIDVLVNVAGGYRGGTPVHETPLATWDFLLNLNARTVYIASSAVIPAMLRQGSGKIVNVAARAALQGAAKLGAYSASKSAVMRLTEAMAAELKNDGINVNCVLPGTIDTPDNRAAMPKADARRWVQPEALADVILFLASDAARAVHGAAVPVYGTG
ncbi:MAG: SDR family oxidoreductase [Anaerolineae bacterium]|nr:SDR family oxidoreductase [Anaerolineae bacterium]